MGTNNIETMPRNHGASARGLPIILITFSSRGEGSQGIDKDSEGPAELEIVGVSVQAVDLFEPESCLHTAGMVLRVTKQKAGRRNYCRKSA